MSETPAIPKDGIPRLVGAVNRLREAFPTAHAVTPRNLVARLVVIGYLREILESAQAVLLLVESHVPRVSFAVARNAFEAFQDVLYILKAPDPALYGARCRVTELIDNHLTQNKGRKAFAAAIGSRPILAPPEEIDDVVQEEAAFLDGLERTAGQVLWDALDSVRSGRERGKWHWSGMNRDELAVALDRILDGTGNTEILRVFYDILSRQTHAAPRCYPPFMEVDERGDVQLLISPTPDEVAAMAGPSIGATLIAVEGVLALLPEIALALE